MIRQNSKSRVATKTRRTRAGVDGTAETVLLMIDVINDFDFPEAKNLLRFALPAARRLAALKKRLGKKGVPAIYVNDNFGRWRSDFRRLVELCATEDCPGTEITKLLTPYESDYFVLKPKHSGFHGTSLDILLAQLRTRRLILTGFASDICVLFTANDAYMRGYEVVVPEDCIAAETAAINRLACDQMQRCLKARVCESRSLTLRQ